VRVLNGSGVPGRAARLAEELRSVGFDVIEVRKAERNDYTKSVIKGSADQDTVEALRTLVASTQIARVERTPTNDPVLTLIVADASTTARPVLLPDAVASTPTASPAPQPGQARTAAERICSS
jgi:hypothetical protein